MEDTFINRVTSAKHEMEPWQSETPDDIEGLRDRWGAMNQRATTAIFALANVRDLHGDIHLFRNLPENYDIEINLVTQIAADAIGGRADSYRDRFQFNDTAEVLETLADELRTIETEEKFDDLMRHMHEYLSFLQHRLWVNVPWHELGVAYEGSQVIETP